MAEFVLGPDVRLLVSSHLASMDHLEVLLLLRDDAPDALATSDIVERTKRPTGFIDTSVQDLVAGGLVAEDEGQGGRRAYRYDPRSESLRHAVDELALMYNERPVTLVRAIYDRVSTPVASFADAFRLRRTQT